MPVKVAETDIYHGKVFGIYKPLEVEQSKERVIITGETFSYTIDKATGQIVSAKAMRQEFLAQGTSFPNPYVGLMPGNDPQASTTAVEADRARFSFEKAIEMRPRLWSGGLTGAYRYDADKSTAVVTELMSASVQSVVVRSRGKYAGSKNEINPLSWQVDYLFDVDGFTKVTVGLSTERPVKIRWHCFNHAFFSREAVAFISRYADLGSPPYDVRPTPTESIGHLGAGEPVMESHWNPVFHLGNPLTGIEFSKEDFSDRWSGYRDSRVILEDGRVVETGVVETRDGKKLGSRDSRGRRGIFTQIYTRQGGKLELEEFDIRNTTFPLNPGQDRRKTLFIQLTPPKKPRDDLNSTRIVWPGPHQINMVRWRGRTEPWAPPTDELVAQWARVGVNLIVGGANYMSGDYSHPTFPDKIHRFLDTAHRYGIKVIPYVTFSDYNFEAPGYQEYAADWICSKGIEYAHHTSLMCFGAEGWREHVERECDLLLENFDFDGLYVDHWFMTRHCNNPRHGCGGYLGRFVTEGYHDFAKRLRRVVARHTDGAGIMLLNSNNLISSTNLAWFDMRLLGENNNPLVLPGETIMSTWNGKRQGVQSAIMWRTYQDAVDMMNFCATFGFSLRLRKSRNNLRIYQDWLAADPNDPESELGYNRNYWEIFRFFDVNRASKFSAFDSREVLSLSRAGSMVTAFARQGRLLLLMSFMAGSAPAGDSGARPRRSEHLGIHKPEALGLDPVARYRVVDLMANRYLDSRALLLEELKKMPVSLTLGRARILMLEPAQEQEEFPRLVYFRGADGVVSEREGEKLTFRVTAAGGSAISLHLDLRGYPEYRSLTGGITRDIKAGGDFAVFSGLLPEDRTVVLSPKAKIE
ncbi:MAG: DUF6259 domain-containing protein [Gemmatimonadota bacterium]|nr:DUF6259 domain-containing protein [Gemmatimonadota bacterium]